MKRKTLIKRVRKWIKGRSYNPFNYKDIREGLNLDPNSTEWESIRKTMYDLVQTGEVKHSTVIRSAGYFVKPVKPIYVFKGR